MKGLLAILLTILLFSCDVPTPVSTCTAEVPATKWTSLDQTQLHADIQAIDSYLSANGIAAVEHPSGVRYVITQAGTGDNVPCLENVLSVVYQGRLFSNSTIFDSATRPAAFIMSNLIPGWQVALLRMNKGAKATIYVPSGLAYGVKGSIGSTTTIPPNAILVFDIQLLDYR